MTFLHIIIRTVFRFVENASQIFSEDAEADKLHRSEEKHYTDECRIASHRVAVHDGLDKYINKVKKSHYARKEAHESR